MDCIEKIMPLTVQLTRGHVQPSFLKRIISNKRLLCQDSFYIEYKDFI